MYLYRLRGINLLYKILILWAMMSICRYSRLSGKYQLLQTYLHMVTYLFKYCLLISKIFGNFAKKYFIQSCYKY